MAAITTPVPSGTKLGENTGPGGALIGYVALTDPATGNTIATLPVSVAALPLPTGAATQGAQASILAAIQALQTGLPLPAGAATQTTLAAVLAKMIAAPATEAKQDATLTAVQALSAALPLPAGAATQTTLAAILAKIIAAPATEAKQDSNLAAMQLVGTRAYAAPLARVAVGATDAASAATTGAEVLLHASTRCFVRVGAAATTSDIPLEAGEKFHLRCAAGSVIHVIRDTADGYLNIVPVA